MREPGHRRSREPFAAKAFGPVLEWQVGRADQAIAVVRRSDDVEEQLGPRLARGHIAPFVKDEEVELGQLLPHPEQVPLLLDFLK